MAKPVELPMGFGALRLDTGKLPVAPAVALRDAWPSHRTA